MADIRKCIAAGIRKDCNGKRCRCPKGSHVDPESGTCRTEDGTVVAQIGEDMGSSDGTKYKGKEKYGSTHEVADEKTGEKKKEYTNLDKDGNKWKTTEVDPKSEIGMCMRDANTQEKRQVISKYIDDNGGKIPTVRARVIGMAYRDGKYVQTDAKGAQYHLDGRRTLDTIYMKEDGSYTEERARLHADMIKDYFERGVPYGTKKDEDGNPIVDENGDPVPAGYAKWEKPPKGQKPVVIITGGGAASGKSSMLKKAGITYPSIDPDAIMAKLPEYKLLMRQNSLTAAAIAHEEASHISKDFRKIAFSQGYNFVVDGTLKNPNAIRKLVKEAQDAGYEIKLMGASLDLEEAESRMKSRYEEEGRYIPEHILKGSHTGFWENCHNEEIRQLIYDAGGTVEIYDNMVARGEPPKLMFSGSADKETVHDEKQWNRDITAKRKKAEKSYRRMARRPGSIAKSIRYYSPLKRSVSKHFNSLNEYNTRCDHMKISKSMEDQIMEACKEPHDDDEDDLWGTEAEEFIQAANLPKKKKEAE